MIKKFVIKCWITNMIAECCNFKVPKEVSKKEHGIFRPLNYGSSKGVKVVNGLSNENVPGIFQEFIPGYDVTTPLLYNPLTEKMDFLPTVLYSPDNNNVNWYLGNEAKETVSGFKRKIFNNINDKLLNKYIYLADKFGVNTYCRIDCRLYTKDILNLSDLNTVHLDEDNCFFIEINPMPTIEKGNNFYVSIQNINEENNFYDTLTYYKEYVLNPTVHGFILSCAMIKKIISKHKK